MLLDYENCDDEGFTIEKEYGVAILKAHLELEEASFFSAWAQAQRALHIVRDMEAPYHLISTLLLLVEIIRRQGSDPSILRPYLPEIASFRHSESYRTKFDVMLAFGDYLTSAARFVTSAQSESLRRNAKKYYQRATMIAQLLDERLCCDGYTNMIAKRIALLEPR